MSASKTIKDRRLLGGLLIAFGIYVLAISIVGAIAFDAFIVDIVGFIMICLGMSVSGGSAKAAKWARIIMCYYASMAILLIVFCSIAPERINVGGRPIKAQEVPVALVLVGIMGVWAIINLLLLWKHKASLSRASQE